MTDWNHPTLDDSLHHPKVDDWNHPNWMIIVRFCSIIIVETTWMIIAYHEKVVQIWMITDGQKLSIFGIRTYLNKAIAILCVHP